MAARVCWLGAVEVSSKLQVAASSEQDMCKDIVQETTPEVSKCFMENLPGLLSG